jgi:hypothetical protein
MDGLRVHLETDAEFRQWLFRILKDEGEYCWWRTSALNTLLMVRDPSGQMGALREVASWLSCAPVMNTQEKMVRNCAIKAITARAIELDVPDQEVLGFLKAVLPGDYLGALSGWARPWTSASALPRDWSLTHGPRAKRLLELVTPEDAAKASEQKALQDPEYTRLPDYLKKPVP